MVAVAIAVLALAALVLALVRRRTYTQSELESEPRPAADPVAPDGGSPSPDEHDTVVLPSLAAAIPDTLGVLDPDGGSTTSDPLVPPASDRAAAAGATAQATAGLTAAGPAAVAAVTAAGGAASSTDATPAHGIATARDAVVPDAAGLTRYLIALGEALIDSASPVAEVTRTLEEIGRVNGYPGTQVIALPTAILVTVPGSEQSQTAAASAGVRSYRLDQIEDVLQIAERSRRGLVGPTEGLTQLRRAVTAPAPYRTIVQLGGYVTYSLGIALILGANLPDLLVAGSLGALVAVVQLATARTSGYLQALLVLASAFTVSAVVFGLVRVGAPIDLLSSLVPPLVMFLPGALLTTAVIDLATRQMIAGSARLAAGAMQLVLLALGISGAAGLVGVRASVIAETPGQAFGPLGPWLGVVVFVVGVALYHCVRLSSMPWVLAVVVVAYAGQVLGGLVFGGVMSALVGAAVMTPLALYAAGERNGPPALVSFLPGFWVLVPGALGLIGVTQTLDGTATDGMGTILTSGATMVAISLGVLVGIALHGLARAVRGGDDDGDGAALA
ncbi:hypothetical protein SERN_0824 [Serinibacter arcticus]|uniref:Threonine/serine exporter-like N-terminal domain-containing protein n=2 Tax=Serinibacter arcticus TaxID=1655435 RepID=A0A4Z1E7F9_9MICO|nr:hypothetical protein SERN_0824 [Serinibacter arcticus]